MLQQSRKVYIKSESECAVHKGTLAGAALAQACNMCAAILLLKLMFPKATQVEVPALCRKNETFQVRFKK